MLMIVGSILSSLFIFTFFKTKVYFTITPQGIDNSEFVFEKINQVKISVNKYQVKIEDNGSAGNKKNREISIQNSSSFRIFENIRPKSSSFLDLGLDMLEIKNSDFGLALFNDVSSKQPDVIKFATKTHRLACGMKVAFLLDININ